MSTVNVLGMPETSQYASDPAGERATTSRHADTDKGEGSSKGAYNNLNGVTSSPQERQYQEGRALNVSHTSPGAFEAGDGDQEAAAGPSRRPPGIALPAYQALAHDPVYMAARTSPIGPPPRAALPALPPDPSSSRGPTPRTGLPTLPAQQRHQQHNNPSGMLAMANEGRPLTAVYNGEWSYATSPKAGQSSPVIYGASDGLRQRGPGDNTSAMEDRANLQAKSPSKQRRQQESEDSSSGSRPGGSSRHERQETNVSIGSSPIGPSSNNGGVQASQAEGSTEKMASKTVLTIALLEAQTAVDLDESDQAEAAIASYSKSVELLQEVMRRVSENAGTYRQKEMDRIAEIKNQRMVRWKQWRLEQYRRAGLQINPEELSVNDEDIETREERREREKREARIAKRERMRVEECAKLRVIHDTYAERVRALEDEISARDSQQEWHGSAQTNFGPRHDEVLDTRQRLSALSLDSSGSRKTQSASHPAETPIHSSHAGQRSIDNRGDSAARAGIGSAMVANSPISPTFANQVSTSTSPPNRILSSAVPFPASSPTSQSNARLSYISSSSTSPPSLALPEIHPFSFSPANSASASGSSHVLRGQQTSSLNQHSILSFSPDSETSDNSAFSEQQQSPGTKKLRTHRKNASSASSFARPSSEGYATFGDLAAQQLHQQSSPKTQNVSRNHEVDETIGPEGLTTPTPDTAFSKAFAPRFDQEERNAPSADATRSGAHPRTADALKRQTSDESLTSMATSSSLGRQQGNGLEQMEHPLSMPTIPKVASVPSPPTSDRADRRASLIASNRPLRSASLVAGQPAPRQPSAATHTLNSLPASASESQQASALLINPSTLHGTISQRRKSPQVPDTASFPTDEDGDSNMLGIPQSSYEGMSGLGLSRTTSTERASGNRALALKSPEPSTAVSSTASLSPSPQSYNVAGSSPMRVRALSQPSKRPALPSHHSDFGSDTSALPVPGTNAPSMQRADSDPSNTSGMNHGPPPAPNMPTTPMSFEYPGSLNESIHTVPGSSVVDDITNDQMVSPAGTQQAAVSTRKAGTPHAASFLEPDTPASMSFQQQHAQPSSGNGLQMEYQPPPADIMRVPFHFMRQMRASIMSGAYLTPRLYIPKQLWSQSSIKLVHTETKVRMLDLLLNGLESIERTAGDILLIDGNIKAGNVGSKIDAANRLMRELESFDGMLDGVQSTLAKKLPYIEQPNGKKGGGGSFGVWSSKLSRSMDRMTKGKNLDAPETYVAAIARLCLHAQILDRHLASLHCDGHDTNSSGWDGGVKEDYRLGSSNQPLTSIHTTNVQSSMSTSATTTTTHTPSNRISGYDDIPADRRAYIEMRLKRTSDFFSRVICKMLLNDLGIWLDKYSKRAAGWTTD